MLKNLLLKSVSVLFIGLAYTQANALELNTTNSIIFKGEVGVESVEQAMQDLRTAVKTRGNAGYTLYLVLDSPGGSIDAGMDFIEYAKSVPNLKTVTIFAASMASAIVQALPGERLITGSGMMMFHRAAGGFQGQFETGEVESRLEMAKQIVLSMENTNASRMSLTLKSYKDLVVNEYWLYGANAVTKKAADSIIQLTCSEELIDKKINSVVYTFFGPVQLEFSSCPLFKGYKINNAEDKNKYEAHFSAQVPQCRD